MCNSSAFLFKICGTWKLGYFRKLTNKYSVISNNRCKRVFGCQTNIYKCAQKQLNTLIMDCNVISSVTVPVHVMLDKLLVKLVITVCATNEIAWILIFVRKKNGWRNVFDGRFESVDVSSFQLNGHAPVSCTLYSSHTLKLATHLSWPPEGLEKIQNSLKLARYGRPQIVGNIVQKSKISAKTRRRIRIWINYTLWK